VVPVKVYAYMLMLLVIFWPFFLLFAAVPWLKIIILIVISAGLFALVARYASTPEVPFLNGLTVISGALTSGCADFTIIYLLPFLVVVYLIFVYHTIIGLGSGRKYTQYHWTQFTDKFYAILANRLKKL
jgi:hypothetical protein